MYINRIFLTPLLTLGFLATLSLPAFAQAQIFNSADAANNAATRTDWLAAVGIVSPTNLVDFESGFANNQNIHNVNGLFPAGLIIRDTSPAAAAIIRSGAGIIGGSNPVGTFALTHNEQADLVLDFSANPIDYLAFQDIDQAGTSALITFLGGATQNVSFETTASSGDTAEFIGIWRNDRPQIVQIAMNASGDARWGIDNIEYGSFATGASAPEPATAFLMLAALGGVIAARRRFSA
jgi:hypothetical protein